MAAKQITQARLVQAEFARVVFHATPTPDTSHEDLLDPAYWSHVARDLKPGTLIQAMPEHSEWFAEYIVLSASTNWAKLALLRFVELAAPKADVPKAPAAAHVVNWGGSIQKFRIVRTADKEVIKAGFDTKAQAETELASYEKALEH